MGNKKTKAHPKLPEKHTGSENLPFPSPNLSRCVCRQFPPQEVCYREEKKKIETKYQIQQVLHTHVCASLDSTKQEQKIFQLKYYICTEHVQRFSPLYKRIYISFILYHVLSNTGQGTEHMGLQMKANVLPLSHTYLFFFFETGSQVSQVGLEPATQPRMTLNL